MATTTETQTFYKIFMGGPGGPHRALAPPTVDGVAVDVPIFHQRRPIDPPGQMTTTVLSPGTTLDFSWVAGIGIVPVASTAAKDVIEAVAPGSVQWFPITVEGDPEPRWLANILHEVDCIDEERTDGTKDEKGWKMVLKISIRPGLDPEPHIFWTKDWVAMIMSGQLKAELDAHGFQGINYTQLP